MVTASIWLAWFAVNGIGTEIHKLGTSDAAEHGIFMLTSLAAILATIAVNR